VLGFATLAPLGRIILTTHNFWKHIQGAFDNDDSLGKAKNAGLKNGPDYNEQVTVNGKAVPGAVVGQKITVVAGRARVKIPVNCQKGDCGTCMVKVNGRKVKGKWRSFCLRYCVVSTAIWRSPLLGVVHVLYSTSNSLPGTVGIGQDID
jgi:ferredoxin